MVWIWGCCKKPKLHPFSENYKLDGAVISAVDLIKGIGIYAGLEIIKVPGATGYLDTNYENKASYALRALEKKDFVYLHVESIDEAAHAGDVKAKIKAIEDFDRRLIARNLDGLQNFDRYKILLLTDQYTPIAERTHTNEPVPFAILSSDAKNEKDSVEKFDEEAARKGIFGLVNGIELMKIFL